MMQESEIYDALLSIEQDAINRGLGVNLVDISIANFRDGKVHAYISVRGGREIKVDASTFADAIADLKEALANYTPDEARLASILGYSEVTLQAAE